MASLDDVVTVQKNGVIAVNALVKELSAFKEIYASVIGSKSVGGIVEEILVLSKPGRVVGISVAVAGAVEGTVHDTSVVASADNSNAILAIPISVGFYPVNFPVENGIVLKPAASSVVGIVYTEG